LIENGHRELYEIDSHKNIKGESVARTIVITYYKKLQLQVITTPDTLSG
jgi:hypothetical protein